MKTKAQAIKRLTSEYKMSGYVYQFPAGHWNCCSLESPVGQSLADSGYIYPEFGIKAARFERVAVA